MTMNKNLLRRPHPGSKPGWWHHHPRWPSRRLVLSYSSRRAGRWHHSRHRRASSRRSRDAGAQRDTSAAAVRRRLWFDFLHSNRWAFDCERDHFFPSKEYKSEDSSHVLSVVIKVVSSIAGLLFFQSSKLLGVCEDEIHVSIEG